MFARVEHRSRRLEDVIGGRVMEIRTTSLLFPETSGSGPATAQAELTFPRDVVRVAAGITGYSVLYEDESDHHLGRLEVEINSRVDPDDATKVKVTGAFGLRDWSNEFDDPYSGVIDVAVLADLVAVTPPGPGDARGDLVIVGAEVTQAIQHFRSADHLDAPNVFPDNSIRLVAGKPTVIRLYVDYDANSGLPPITWLTGSLTLVGPSGTTVLTPIEAIQPRREGSIVRGIRKHTLNFLLSDTLSVGDVEMSASVSALWDVTQFSPPFQRTLRFEPQAMLPVLAVGVEYTGPDVVDGADPADLLAPTQADFVDTLEFTDRIYPVPGVTLTDYRTMEYDGELESDISKGCDKFDDLKDAVSDFAGDSDDVVYGLIGRGVETGSVGGCGGGGVGVGIVRAGGTAAHEIGHALGRRHAPCDNVTRCSTPKNTDGGYPVYSGFDSDSIGEFGFDPTTAFGTVMDPANAHDFMSYSPLDWVSPYTYKALMSAVPGSTLSAAGGASRRAAAGAEWPGRTGDSRAEWIPVKQPHLHLRLDVHGDRAVLHPSFDFDTRPRRTTGAPTDYVFELRDDDDRVLGRTCLVRDHVDCGCECGCGDEGEHGGSDPVRIRQAVPFDRRARVAVLYDCDEELARWKVPPPPEVEVRCRADEEDRGSMWLGWRIRRQGADGEPDAVAEADTGEPDAEAQAPNSEPDAATEPRDRDRWWALVQWQDRDGTWRGIAPRTRERRMRVPRRIARMGSEPHYRVLVTDGLGTGVGTWDGDCDGEAPPKPDRPEVVIVGASRGEGATELPRVIRAVVLGSDRPNDLRWYDGSGGELARGSRLDLGSLPVGRTVVTVRANADRVPTPSGQWQVERTRDDRFVLHRGDVPKPAPRDDRGRVQSAGASEAASKAQDADRDRDHDHDDRRDHDRDHDHDHDAPEEA